MAIYSYTALNGNEIVRGRVEAENERDARSQIRAKNLVPTKIIEDTAIQKQVIGVKKAKRGIVTSLSLQEKIDFTSTLQILAQAGIPIIESLLFIENDAAKLKLRLVSQELRRQIMNGATFAETISKYPNQFGQIYIGLVRAGEDSGELEKTLERLLDLLNKQAAIKSKVIGTLMYPAFVIILAICIVLVMLVFVFPVFKDMFDQMGKDLPWITQTLMDIGVTLKQYWYFIPLGFIVISAIITFLFRWRPSKNKIDDISLKIPILSNLLQFSDFSNFIAVMQVAYDAGIPIVECLVLATFTLTNHTLKLKISASMTKVQQGQHLSSALRATNAIPKMILFMISTGEQSGRLGDMLLQATNYIDRELEKIIDTMTKMIEPIMLIVIGSIVLTLALALYLPLFGSYMS